MVRAAVCVWVALWGMSAFIASARAADPRVLVDQLATAKGAQLEKVKSELVAMGMEAHAALKSGSPETAKVRAELRKAIRAKRDAAALASGLVLHEWGVITTQQNLEKEALGPGGEDAGVLFPEFVHIWSKQARPQRDIVPGGGIQIDPVIMLYPDKEGSKFATITVVIPRGIPTHWYPQVTRVHPAPGQDLKNIAIGGGELLWKNVALAPQQPKAAMKPAAEGSFWAICRQTDGAPLLAGEECEKFLYYAGRLSDAELPLTVEGGAQQRYTLKNAGREPLREAIVLNVAGASSASYQTIDLPGQKAVAVESVAGATRSAKVVADEVGARLEETLAGAGLFEKEAAGAVKILRQQFLERPGVRIVYLFPAGSSDRLAPMSVKPRPASSVRVMIGVVECLKDSVQNVLKDLITQLGDDSFQVRENAQRELISLGDKARGALEEALKKCDDEELRSRLQSILRRIDPKSKAHEQPAAQPEVPDVPGVIEQP